MTGSRPLETIEAVDPDSVVVRLSAEELELVLDGLDALEYWEAGFALPRNNGAVFIPGDIPLADDPYWRATEPSAEEVEGIGQVRRCRELAASLRSIVVPQVRKHSSGDPSES